MESLSIASGLLVRPKPSTKTIDSPADLSDEASRSFKRQGEVGHIIALEHEIDLF